MLLSSLFEVISNVLLQGGSGTDFPDNVNVAEAVDATTEMAKGMDKVVAIPLVCIPVGSNSLLMLPFFILQPLSNKFLVLRCVTPLPSLSCFQRAPGAAFFACQVGSTILLVALSNNQVCLFSYTLFNTTFLTSSNIFHHVFDVTPCVFQVINLRLI